MLILRAETHRRMAWKNGGGETIELAVHPEGADLSAFGWRVSMARVDRDGPFSVFAGIDRTLCVLEGEGMSLLIEGMGERTLQTESHPLRFPADAATQAHLLGDSIVDLNVMTRRGAFDHRVERLRINSRHTVRPSALQVLILSLGEIAAEKADGTVHALRPRDALLLRGDDAPVALFAAPLQTVFLIEIDAAAPVC